MIFCLVCQGFFSTEDKKICFSLEKMLNIIIVVVQNKYLEKKKKNVILNYTGGENRKTNFS